MAAWLAALLSRATARARARPGASPESWADRADIQASRDGDGEAYARIIRRYRHEVAARMWRFTRDREAFEELVHEVFVEAYFSLPRYREMDSFGGWLNTIATRVGYRFWKRRKRAAKVVPLGDRDVAVEADVRNDADAAAERLHAMLGQLRPRDRLVLTLLYWEGCSVAEAARQTGWSKTMVKVQAHRARKRLRRLLEAPGEAEDER